MNIAPQIWIDGKIQNHQLVTVSLLSHSLHYGSAIFEGMRFYDTPQGPAVFRLKDHIERFFHSAQAIGFPITYSQEELLHAVLETIAKNPLSNGYIRLIGYFGDGDMELHPTKASTHIAIILWPWPARLGNNSIKLTISSLWRTPPQCTVISAKISGHYGNSILARQEARRKGFHEALLLDYQGNIAEGSGANFFGIKNGMLFTPPETNIFAGVTRNSIIEVAQHLNIPVQIKTIAPDELSQFEEAFLSGTAVEVVSIERIDDCVFPHSFGPITKKLKEFYAQVVHGDHPVFAQWLETLPLKVHR